MENLIINELKFLSGYHYIWYSMHLMASWKIVFSMMDTSCRWTLYDDSNSADAYCDRIPYISPQTSGSSGVDWLRYHQGWSSQTYLSLNP